MDRARAANGLAADLGEAEVFDVTLLDQILDGKCGILDRHVWVEPRWAIDVDRVHTQALQAVGERCLHRRGPRVVAEPAAVWTALRAELDGDAHTIAPPDESAADQHLVVAHPIEIAGVYQRDAAVDRFLDGGD